MIKIVGGGVIFEPKTLSRYQGIKKKEFTKTGFEPKTSRLENLSSYPLGSTLSQLQTMSKKIKTNKPKLFNKEHITFF